MPLLLRATSSAQAVRCGALGLGAGAVLKGKNTYKLSSVNPVTRMCKDGNATANNKGKQMEYKSAGDLAVNWAIDRYSRAEEIAEQLRNHWAEIWPENTMSEEELTWKLLPIAIDILKQHPEFADVEMGWDY
jgi:hypothetical protein